MLAGECGAYFIDFSCHASSSMKVAQQVCLNQASCTIPANDQVFGDPCFGTFKKLIVSATCSEPPSNNYLNILLTPIDVKGYQLSTQIPTNTFAQVHVSKLALVDVTITESGTTVWENGRYVSGVDGVFGGNELHKYE